MRDLLIFVMVTTWLAGIVLAKGFWLTVLAVCLPFYAWYLLIERVMQRTGFVS